MIRVNARLLVAEMVEFNARRQRPKPLLIFDAVGVLPISADGENAIASIQRFRPKDAITARDSSIAIDAHPTAEHTEAAIPTHLPGMRTRSRPPAGRARARMPSGSTNPSDRSGTDAGLG
jgi:hypothetical protein